MASIGAIVRGVLLGVVVSGCGGNAPSESHGDHSGGSGPVNGGGKSAQSGGSSTQDSGAPSQGSGGNGGATTEQCKTVDGKLAYGPIGKPYPLPPGTGSNGFGFRTEAGYAFVWGLAAGSDVPSWSLNSLTVDSNLAGGEPREVLSRNSTLRLEVIRVPDGFLAMTCSEDSKAEWIRLNRDLEIAGGASPITPEAPCEYRQPSLLWTGKGYLTYFVDTRGLVLAWLDEQGAIVREQILSEENTAHAKAGFSMNGDRILVASVRGSGGLARYGVFDLQGKLVGDVHPLGEEKSFPLHLAVTTSGDGWLVVSDYAVTNKSGIRLAEISRDGLVSREQRQWSGYPSILGFTRSAYDGFLYTGTYYSGGQFGADYKVIGLLDDAGEPAYYESVDFDTAESWPFAVIDDPHRDLVLQSSLLDDSSGMVFVQEYGCLD